MRKNLQNLDLQCVRKIAQNLLQNPKILASKAFIKKEFLHIFRDIRTVMILVLMPLVQILLFGFALSSEVRNVNFALLDFANDSKKIISHLSQNPHFTIAQNLTTAQNLTAIFHAHLWATKSIFC